MVQRLADMHREVSRRVADENSLHFTGLNSIERAMEITSAELGIREAVAEFHGQVGLIGTALSEVMADAAVRAFRDRLAELSRVMVGHA